MRRVTILLVVGLLGFTALGSRFGYEERCKDLAAAIVEKMFENSPITRIDIERIEAFEELGCSDVFLEVERQRIIRFGVD